MNPVKHPESVNVGVKVEAVVPDVEKMSLRTIEVPAAAVLV